LEIALSIDPFSALLQLALQQSFVALVWTTLVYISLIVQKLKRCSSK